MMLYSLKSLKNLLFNIENLKTFLPSGRCIHSFQWCCCNTPRNTDYIDSLSHIDVTFKSELFWLDSCPHVLIYLWLVQTPQWLGVKIWNSSLVSAICISILVCVLLYSVYISLYIGYPCTADMNYNVISIVLKRHFHLIYLVLQSI